MLVLTVGLPRAGKSTWAMRTGYPVVNPDSIRLALHGHPFCESAERMVWATAHLMVEALFKAGHCIVILDATNLTKFRRAEWRSKEWTTRCMVFETDVETCRARALRTGQDYLLSVIDRMALTIEWPEQEERFEILVSRDELSLLCDTRDESGGLGG